MRGQVVHDTAACEGLFAGHRKRRNRDADWPHNPPVVGSIPTRPTVRNSRMTWLYSSLSKFLYRAYHVWLDDRGNEFPIRRGRRFCARSRRFGGSVRSGLAWMAIRAIGRAAAATAGARTPVPARGRIRAATPSEAVAL